MMQDRVPAIEQDRSGDFVLNMLYFARQLKERGLPVTLGRTLDALRGLKLIRLEDRQEAHSLLSAHYITQPEELSVFDAVFEKFWCLKDPPDVPASKGHVQLSGPFPLSIVTRAGREKDHLRHDLEMPPYSPQKVLHKKDFAGIFENESEDVCRLIMALAQNLGLRMGRRWRTKGKGKRRKQTSACSHGSPRPTLQLHPGSF